MISGHGDEQAIRILEHPGGMHLLAMIERQSVRMGNETRMVLGRLALDDLIVVGLGIWCDPDAGASWTSIAGGSAGRIHAAE